MTADPAALLPCPFCGADAVLEHPSPGVAMVYCSALVCPVHASTGWCDESQGGSVVDLWNQRVEPSAPGWIACSERMPPTGRGRYWVYRPAYVKRGGQYPDYMGQATFDDTDDDGPWYSTDYLGCAPVTHWRLLPENPDPARSEGET